MLTPRKSRLAALACQGDLNGTARPPILLIPGTQVYASENWDPSYQPVLRNRGHAVCYVDLPKFGTRDVQANAEYVATAIRSIASRSQRRISIIGHSQGAYLPHIALRTWPDLAAHVNDVVGLAGVYDRGTNDFRGKCQNACTPVLHQLATGSDFLTRIRKRRLPTGPDYTNIGTLGDGTITPQPVANRQPGARSVILQNLCPGRVVQEPEHAMIVGDNAALKVTLDALNHRGPADPSRIDQAVCATDQYPGFDSAAYLAVAPLVPGRAGPSSTREPRLYCRYRETCSDPRLRGRLILKPRYTIRAHTVIVRARALVPGRIEVRLGSHKASRKVRPGIFDVRFDRPDKRLRLKVLTRPRYYTVLTTEATKWIPRRR